MRFTVTWDIHCDTHRTSNSSKICKFMQILVLFAISFRIHLLFVTFLPVNPNDLFSTEEIKPINFSITWYINLNMFV